MKIDEVHYTRIVDYGSRKTAAVGDTPEDDRLVGRVRSASRGEKKYGDAEKSSADGS